MEPFEKTFQPKECEQKWYRFWEEHSLFHANATSSKTPFSIVIPPPNITGILHMGHALVNTLQDIVIRYKRMTGFEALWVPGTDHAGIATQGVVERSLRTQGLTKENLGKHAFIETIWKWKATHEKVVLEQLKKLGCSCDWSRLHFTMDEPCSFAVRTLFKRLFDQQLIYRGDYLVHWDPVTGTALSDDEVEYEEQESFLWYIRYPFADHSGYITVATTRPETLLGDTAVAVNPEDPRYHDSIGHTVLLPFTHRRIPVIADPLVDPHFGTGALKVTPGHSHDDYALGIKHHLPIISVLTYTGHINEVGGPFAGLSREEGRHAIVEGLRALHLIEKIEPHRLRVAISYRSKAVLEPMISKQWFLKMEPFIPILREAVLHDHVALIPSHWKGTYFHWINHLRDWCISRQLWWGHQIPVWYHKETGRVLCSIETPQEVLENPSLWEQDPDVLDTWFSSALWPLSVFGWPEATEDLDRFYPTSVLITGHDILFFWVARMIALGTYATGKIPFSKVFLHGLIFGKSYWYFDQHNTIHYITGAEREKLDAGAPLPPGVQTKWEKISKSKGNVIDPIDMIERYGTDAVRMTLASIANQSPQIDLDKRRFEEWKHFTNKVWNGARFVFTNIHDLPVEELYRGLDLSLHPVWDQWIITLYDITAYKMNQALDAFSFDIAASLAYDFFWKEFCAYYVEIVKPILGQHTPQRTATQKILVHVLTGVLRLLHPFAPFITEELFQKMKTLFPPPPILPLVDPLTRSTHQALSCISCMQAPYPQGKEVPESQSILETFTLLEQIIYLIRKTRGEMKLAPQDPIDVYLVQAPIAVQENQQVIMTLANVEQSIFVDHPPSFPFSSVSALGELQIIIPIPEKYQAIEHERLLKEKALIEKQLQKLQGILENPLFVARADPRFVEEQLQKYQSLQQELALILERLS